MTKKLNPCPYCGKEGHIRTNYSTWRGQKDKLVGFEPHCHTFGCQGSVGIVYTSEEAAIERWNTRTPKIVQCCECGHYEKSINICDILGMSTFPDWVCRCGKLRGE